MNHFSHARLRRLATHQGSPCISIFQPTSRRRPANQQDPIRFRNLIRKVEQELHAQSPGNGRDLIALLEPLHDLAGNDAFWNHTHEGLALFLAPGVFEVFLLQQTVPEKVVVSERFMLRPVIRQLQSSERFQVLCLTRDRAVMYAGDRFTLEPLALPQGFPATLVEALGSEKTEPHRVVASSQSGVGSAPHYSSVGTRKDEIEVDTVRYFRAVDKAVLEHFSKPSHLPLILAALTEHQPVFREVSGNPRLIAQGIEINPMALSTEALRLATCAVLDQLYQAKLERFRDAFRKAKSHNAGTDRLPEAARAAADGRISMLLVDELERIPGAIRWESGELLPDSPQHPESGDILDELAEMVLAKGGETLVVPKGEMPSETGLAAIYRF